METPNLTIIITIICFLIAAIALFLVFRFYKRKVEKIKKTELDSRSNEMQVPLLAGFLGIKFLPPLLGFAKNNINPQLNFLWDGIEYKLLTKKFKKYSDIAMVDILILAGTKNLIFKFFNSIFTFSGNLYSEDNLRSALGFLQKKNCPLSPRAKEFLMK